MLKMCCSKNWTTLLLSTTSLRGRLSYGTFLWGFTFLPWSLSLPYVRWPAHAQYSTHWSRERVIRWRLTRIKVRGLSLCFGEWRLGYNLSIWFISLMEFIKPFRLCARVWCSHIVVNFWQRVRGNLLIDRVQSDIRVLKLHFFSPQIHTEHLFLHVYIYQFSLAFWDLLQTDIQLLLKSFNLLSLLVVLFLDELDILFLIVVRDTVSLHLFADQVFYFKSQLIPSVDLSLHLI